jgi:hypothetical protein
MTGLGEEVVTRCPTCGYGLTARRYAVPKQCPLCRGSFDAEFAPAPQLTTGHEPRKEDVVEDKVKDDDAEGREASEEPRESRITLSVKPDVETGPLGVTTQRMPDAEPEEATPESKEREQELTIVDKPLESEIVETQPASREPVSSPYAPRDSNEPPQEGAHIEHATPAASARAEMRSFVPPTTKMDTFQTPPVSLPQPSSSQLPSSQPSPQSSPQPTPSQPTPQPVRAGHARGSLEERVSPEVVGRYADAYRVARATILIGNLIKLFGVLFGLLVGGGLFALVATQGRLLGITGAVGFFAGLLGGGSIFAFFFVLGVVISAQGQLTKATLDGAVNGSPFLTNDQRAEAMSLR